MNKLNHYFAFILIIPIQFYRYCISPMIGQRCRFSPTCSEYALIALKRFGFIKGSWLMLQRVLKCHPLNKGGDDPVPPKDHL